MEKLRRLWKRNKRLQNNTQVKVLTIKENEEINKMGKTKFNIGDYLSCDDSCGIVLKVLDISPEFYILSYVNRKNSTMVARRISNVDTNYTKIEPAYKRWRADRHDFYWLFDLGTGITLCAVEEKTKADNYRYRIGNYFRSEEEAKDYGNYIASRQVLIDDTKGFEPDWTDASQDKWYGFFNFYDHTFNTKHSGTIKYQDAICFKSKEDLEDSFREHKDEWYTVLGIESK